MEKVAVAPITSESTGTQLLRTNALDLVPKGTMQVGVSVDYLDGVFIPLSGLAGDLTRYGTLRADIGFGERIEVQVRGILDQTLSIDAEGDRHEHDRRDPEPADREARGAVQRLLRHRARDPTEPTAPESQNDVVYGLAATSRVSPRFTPTAEVNGRWASSGFAPGTEDHAQIRAGGAFRHRGFTCELLFTRGLTRFDENYGIALGASLMFRARLHFESSRHSAIPPSRVFGARRAPPSPSAIQPVDGTAPTGRTFPPARRPPGSALAPVGDARPARSLGPPGTGRHDAGSLPLERGAHGRLFRLGARALHGIGLSGRRRLLRALWRAFYYLLAGRNACGQGTLGSSFDGQTIPNPSPCP